MKRIVATTMMFLLLLTSAAASTFAAGTGITTPLNRNAASRNSRRSKGRPLARRGRVHADARHSGSGAVRPVNKNGQSGKPNMNARHHPKH